MSGHKYNSAVESIHKVCSAKLCFFKNKLRQNRRGRRRKLQYVVECKCQNNDFFALPCCENEASSIQLIKGEVRRVYDVDVDVSI
jgi:hypothetical protein